MAASLARFWRDCQIANLQVIGGLEAGSQRPLTITVSWISDVMAHGSGEPELPATAADREEWGKQGQAQMVAVVQKMRLKEAMEALRQHDKFTQEEIVPKLGKYLPAVEDWR